MNDFTPQHIPVLADEVLQYLDPQPGQTLIDATVGLGGHSALLASRLSPDGRLIGFDRDPAMLELAESRLESLPVTLIQGSFDQIRQILSNQGIDRVDGILADLGICSAQLDDAERGFSFQKTGLLDMRMNPLVGESARALLKRLSEKDLADIFYRYGEEKFSRRIARRIVATRKTEPLETTEQLANLVRSCIPRPKGKKREGIDPATRTFQALRIAVNDELAILEGLLKQLPRCLNPGGKAVIISFHSLEDRRVKQTFRENGFWDILTRKPVQASEEEKERNPRSRSARLRAAQLSS